jgi:O-antigen/teichoic acid export membrane protein
MPDARPDARADEGILDAAKGGGIAFAGRVFTWAARLGLAVLLARLLGADEYGLYNLALTVATVMASFPSLGLDSALVRFMAVYSSRGDPSRLRGSLQIGIGIPLLLSVLAGIVLFLAAELIATGVMHDQRLTPLLQIASVLVPATVVNRQLAAALQGLRRLGDAVRAEQFAQPASRVIMLLAIAAVGLTAAWAVAASAIAALVATLLMILLLSRAAGAVRGVLASREIRALTNHAVPVFFSNVVNTFGGNLQTLFLGAMSSATSVGIFAIANQVTLVGSMFHQSVAASSMPVFAEYADRDDRAGGERLYRITSKWTFTLNLPLFCLVLVFPDALLSLFGREFEAGSTALIILAWGALANAATGTSGAILDMAGHTRVKFLNSTLSLGLAIGLSLMLIPPLGIVGAAIAAVGSVVFVNLLRVVEVALLVHITPYDAAWLKPLGAGAVALAAGLGAASLAGGSDTVGGLAAGAITLIVVYVAAIFALGISEDDRMVLGRAGRKLTRLGRRRGSRAARQEAVLDSGRRDR